jgi:hypothetical protein
MHTREPWTIRQGKKSADIVGALDESEGGYRVICTVFGPDPEARANARLIAAAPKMYHWLKHMALSWDDEASAIIAEIEVE